MSEIYLENPTDEDYKALIGSGVTSIITNGHNPALTDQALIYASKIPGLRSIDLEWATEITDAGLEHLYGLKKLEYIDLSFCSRVTASGVQGLRKANGSLVIEL